MLVLTRKRGQCIRIGEAITIKVLAIQGGQVRIGIEAPREIPVHRAERVMAMDVPGSPADEGLKT